MDDWQWRNEWYSHINRGCTITVSVDTESSLSVIVDGLIYWPGAVVDEDALPDGERAVVPHQQEVEHGIEGSETKT